MKNYRLLIELKRKFRCPECKKKFKDVYFSKGTNAYLYCEKCNKTYLHVPIIDKIEFAWSGRY